MMAISASPRDGEAASADSSSPAIGSFKSTAFEAVVV